MTKRTRVTKHEEDHTMTKRTRVTKHEAALCKSLCGVAVLYKQATSKTGNLHFARSNSKRYARAMFDLVLSRKGEADEAIVQGLTYTEATIFINGMKSVLMAAAVASAVTEITEPVELVQDEQLAA